MRKKIKKILLKVVFFLKMETFYYSVLNKSFKGDFKAVFRGIHKNQAGNNLGNLRRNIHRIEKGLITVPRKKIFAEGYLEETVVSFCKAQEAGKLSFDMLGWGKGVLDKYFSVVEKSKIVERAEALYSKLKIPEHILTAEPFDVRDRESCDVSFEEFYKLNKYRRSVRYYQDKKVPRFIIEKAIEVGLQAPSACNRQPFVVHVVDSEEYVRKAAGIPNGAKVFADNVKVMLFVIGDLSYYFSERDKHLIYIDGSLFIMNFILALETLGVSSCVINWADLPKKNKELQEFLKLEDYETCIATISIGYAKEEGGIPSSVKKNVREVVKYQK